jgi:signal peptidase II
MSVEAVLARWISFLAAAAIGLGLDLGSKDWAWENAQLKNYGKIDVIPGWFDFMRSTNQGAAWGLLWGQYTFFLVVSVIAFLAIIYFVHTGPKNGWKGSLVLGLVFAGVAGNFFDRAMYGHVRDFLHAHTAETGLCHDFTMRVFGRSEWPTFNVADVFICIGAGALVLVFWRDDRAKSRGPAAAAPALAPPVPAPIAPVPEPPK